MTLTVIHVASGRRWRGGERQVWLLARGLAQQNDVQQVVLTRRGSPLASRCRESGIEVSARGWTAALDPRALIGLVGELSRRRGSRPVLHAHDPHALILAGLAVRLCPAWLVASRRMDLPLHRPGFWARADRVIAVSEAVGRTLSASGVPAHRIVVVRSSVDTERRIMPAPLRQRLGLPPDTALVITVGALEGWKDHDTLLRAAELIQGAAPVVHWVVVGEGPRRAELERRAEGAALHGRVHLVGQVEDPGPLVAAADLYVASSLSEGLNTSILEAHLAGVPVVGTDAGGIPEALAGGSGVIVPRQDPAALAKAIRDLLTAPTRRAELVRAARAALPGWSAERMTAEVLSVYRSLDRTP
jgi:glycosyltransferase involved in cell wall biosynthesis